MAAVGYLVIQALVFGCGGGSETSCGPGTTLLDGACVAAQGCPAGTSPASGTTGACTPNCGAGTHLDDTREACVADVSCGAGTVASGGQCVPSGAGTCAQGTHLVGMECVPDDTCGPGTHDVGGACAPDEVCGPGTHDASGTCVSDSTSICGAGMHLDGTSNSCLADVTCGPNTTPFQGKCVVFLGGDGPTTWSANVQISPTLASDGTPLVAYEPQLAVAQPVADGPVDVYIAYPTFHGTASDVRVAISHDDGATFPLVYTEASTNPVFGAPEHIGDPAIVARHSTVALAFINYRVTGCAVGQPSCGDLVLDISTDRGQTWSGPKALVASSPYLIDRPFWSVGLDGYLYLSFTWVSSGVTGPVLDTRIVRIDSAGNALLFAHGLGGLLSQAPVVANARGALFGTLDADLGDLQAVEVVTAPDDDSLPFSLVTARNSDQSRANDFRNLNQSLAINGAGEMLLVWRFNIGGSTRIASTVTSGGAWASGGITGTLVDDAPLAVNAAYPVATADENGRWHALWQDNRYGSWATYSSSSVDGKSWSPSSFVSDAFYTESGQYDPTTLRLKAFLGDYNSIAAAGGVLFAAWVDTRNGTSQVFFATAANP